MLLIKNYGDLCTAAYNIWCSIVSLQIFTTLGCSLQQQNGALYPIKPSLVRRDEILLGFDVINNWDNELEEMNKYKVGQEPFHYTNNFLLLLGYAKAYFHLPYRQTEGIAHAHAKGWFHQYPITLQ